MAPHRIQEVALVNTYCEKVQIINNLWLNNFEQMRHTEKTLLLFQSLLEQASIQRMGRYRGH